MKIKYEIIRHSVCVGAFSVVCASFAVAQTAPGNAEDDIVKMDVFDVSASRDVGYISKNAESATRLNVPISDIPQNILVFNETFMNDIMAETLADVVTYDPTITAYNESDNFTMRGFGGSSAYGAGVYFNGFEQTPVLGSMPMVNATRTEVLKGPNAILYGTGAFGGIINIVPKKPTGKKSTSVEGTLNSNGYYQIKLDAGNALVPKKLSYRFNMMWGDGENWNSTPRSDFVVAPSIGWNIGSRTTLIVDYVYQRQKLVGNFEFPIHNGDPLHIVLGDGTSHEVDVRRFLGEANDCRELIRNIGYVDFRHEFSTHILFRSMFNLEFQDQDISETVPDGHYFDPETAMVSRFYRHRTQEAKNYRMRNEFVFKFPTFGIKHQMIAGQSWDDLYLRSTTWRTQYNIPGAPGYPNVTDGLAPANILTHVPGYITVIPNNVPIPNPQSNPGLIHLARLHEDTVRDSGSLSFYLSDLMSVWNERVFIQAGIRYLDTRRDTTNYHIGSTTDARYNIPIHEYPLTHSFGLVYHVTKNRSVTLYFNNNSTFLPNYMREYPGGPDLPPIEGTQYEGGVKLVYKDKINALFCYFDILQKNVPERYAGTYLDATGAPIPEGYMWRTIKGLHSKGAEFSFNANLTASWSVFGGYAYTDCTNQDTGKRHYRVPLHSLALFSSYGFKTGPVKGLSFNAGLRWYDTSMAQYLEASPADYVRYEPEWKVPRFLSIDVGASYSFRIGKLRMSAKVKVSNLADEINYVTTYNTRASVAAPRTITVALATRF